MVKDKPKSEDDILKRMLNTPPPKKEKDKSKDQKKPAK